MFKKILIANRGEIALRTEHTRHILSHEPDFAKLLLARRNRRMAHNLNISVHAEVLDGDHIHHGRRIDSGNRPYPLQQRLNMIEFDHKNKQKSRMPRRFR